MSSQQRYQIIEEISQGDFAKLLRARDRELGREVAIKQIHPQFLQDPKQLDRYWQEAQLLASLEHPYILRIYDIVRERGWLILELMQGDLLQRTGGNPIDLDYLRITLLHCLQALAFLAENGIVHGDVKPTNLLVDRGGRVKLGDFGLACRIAGDAGSLVKGTPKYMAPEVVSDQFGPVGPHSDLYSLGFSAYELMCGRHFDELFPGLNAFGRDPQMAWMMWHAAADRRLPEVQRVLEGVPDDLATVIQKLTEKDPAVRYRTAEHAVADLRALAKGQERPPSPDDVEKQEQEAKQQKKKRMLAVGALVLSTVLSLTVAFMPAEEPPPPPAPPSEGVVRSIYLPQGQFALAVEGKEKPINIAVGPGDSVVINGVTKELANLQEGDLIVIKRLEGGATKIIEATRETLQQEGKIALLDADNHLLEVSVQGEPSLKVTVPAEASITFNGKTSNSGEPFQLADLQVGDAITVRHGPTPEGRVAQSIEALRVVPAEGYLATREPRARTLTLRMGRRRDAELKQWKVTPTCSYTLNGDEIFQGRRVKLDDLQPEDRLQVQHHAEITRIDAYREFRDTATVAQVDAEGRKLTARLESGEQVEYVLAEDCEIALAETDLTAELSFLQAGDSITVTHDDPNQQEREAFAVEVVPQPDPRAWAVLIAEQNYSDAQLNVAHAGENVRLLREVLTSFYRTPASQVIVKTDATRLELEQSLPPLFSQVPANSQLIVYFAGQGFLDESGRAFLATKEFDVERKYATGLGLTWLVRQMEASPAREKMLLLDTCHGSGSADAAEALVRTVKQDPGGAVAVPVTMIGSCSAGQQGHLVADAGHGLFAELTADAFEGDADTNENRRVDAQELFALLQTRMQEYSRTADAPQTPVMGQPTARLSEKAQAAVQGLIKQLDEVYSLTDLTDKLSAARPLMDGQPDADLAYALVVLKHDRTREAEKVFRGLAKQYPDQPILHQGLAWIAFQQRDTSEGIEHLRRLVESLPKPPAGEPMSEYARQVFRWCGVLLQFAIQAAEKPVPQETVYRSLLPAIAEHGEEAKDLTREGIAHTQKKVAAYDRELESADTQQRARLKIQRWTVENYAGFDFVGAGRELAEGLGN